MTPGPVTAPRIPVDVGRHRLGPSCRHAIGLLLLATLGCAERAATREPGGSAHLFVWAWDVDQTPGQLMRGMRLERAAALVAGKAGNLSEIAYRVGFSDQAHFSRSFKRHFGTTPSEYRDARPGVA